MLISQIILVTGIIVVAMILPFIGIGDAFAQNTTPPIIFLNNWSQNPQIINYGDDYIKLGAECMDDIEWYISSNIVIDSSNVNTRMIGSYQVIYDHYKIFLYPSYLESHRMNIVDIFYIHTVCFQHFPYLITGVHYKIVR